jgi:hypothetical protein
VVVVAARSMATNARTWLEHASRVRVLHVFDRACNLIDSEGRIVSIVTLPISDGPFNIVIPPARFSDWVSSTDTVELDRDSLRIGRLRIDLASAEVWNPRPAWEIVRQRRDWARNHWSLLCDALRDMAPAGSLAGLVVVLPKPASALESDMLRVARSCADDLIAGLERGDRDLCIQGAEGLAGLGGGLTPAGDDWLLGYTLAACAGLPRNGAEPLTRLAANAASRRTTPLAAAWLQAAGRGECSARWHAFFESWIAQNTFALERAAQNIVAQGHTSGADALAGLVAALTPPPVRTARRTSKSPRSHGCPY